MASKITHHQLLKTVSPQQEKNENTTEVVQNDQGYLWEININ